MDALIVYVSFCFCNVFVLSLYEWDNGSSLVCLRFWYYWVVVATRSIRPAKTHLRTHAKSNVANLVLSSCTSMLPHESPECSAGISQACGNSQDNVDLHGHLPVCCMPLHPNISIHFPSSSQTIIGDICSEAQFLRDKTTQDCVPIPWN